MKKILILLIIFVLTNLLSACSKQEDALVNNDVVETEQTEYVGTESEQIEDVETETEQTEDMGTESDNKTEDETNKDDDQGLSKDETLDDETMSSENTNSEDDVADKGGRKYNTIGEYRL
jgi:hypothetical protein